MYPILTAIIICYGAIQFFELTALLSRIAGIQQNAVVIGYSIQQSVYMVTRFFVIGLLPLLGFVIDLGVSARDFAFAAHLSLLAATILGSLAILFSGPIIRYYSGVITRYKSGGGGFVRAFFGKSCAGTHFMNPSILFIISRRETRKTLVQSSLVFLIYSTGIFISFYLALIFYDYRASISQMSGVINAFGAVILTLVVEPKISRAIDTCDENAIPHVFALFWGRLFATAILGQILLASVFFVT
ncbi:MAG: hypothetical protein ACJAS1_006726 [Oleiphilaceae bacterium]|jgi:hypothetical protein